MKTTLLLLGLPALGMAFPGFLGGESREDMLRALEAHNKREAEAKVEKRQLGILPTLTTLLLDVAGLVTSVAENVNPSDARPEPGYTFQAPGPNDSRGPCPGLNLLANYGYLPRNGYVSFDQVVAATA